MDSIFECSSCTSPYDEYTHKPLSLPCGHVFCQDCLSKQGKSLICPTDKSKFDQSYITLPCCYAILGNIPKQAQKEGCCIRHPRKKVKFLCKSHEKFLCTECVIDHTGTGHNIVAFTVNSAVVKSDLRALELICETTLKDCEDQKKEIDSKAKASKEFYQFQIEKINLAYEHCLRNLSAKKKEMIGHFSKILADQQKNLEKNKENVIKVVENSVKVAHKLKTLHSSLPHYESLCQTIKSLKQELKFLEMPIESYNLQYITLKNSEPFTLYCANFEEIDQSEAEKRFKVCHSRPILQTVNYNEEKSPFTKSVINKNSDKSGTENKSPEKLERAKCRQNYHARNHPKRMPWRKRTKSY